MAWVRDEDRDLSTPDRRIALRRLSSPVQLPTELQGRVGSPALSVAPNGVVNLVYTVGENDASISNQLMLHTAAQVCVLGRGCSWQVKKLADNLGRAIYAEHPVPTFDTAGRLTITYRSLGFGPSQSGSTPSLPTDPANVLIGELAKVDINRDTTSVNPAYLTAGDALYTHAAAVYDPLADRIVTLAARGSLPPGASVQARFAPTAVNAWAVVDASVVQTSLSREPDFVLADVRPPVGLPAANGTFSVTVRVGNDGTSWSGEGLDIVATWESGTASGSQLVIEAGRASVAELGAGVSADVALSVTPPSDGFGVGRKLVVRINSGGRIAESNGQNNAQAVDIGLITAPNGIVADVRPGSPLVFLHWPTPEDAHIVGYRIYRLDASGARTPVGSTFTQGWVDLNADYASTYRYVITSFNVDGVESAPSEAIAATTLSASPSAGWSYLPLLSR